MNLHITMTTIPHPEDIAKGCEPQSSQWSCTPDKLAEVLAGFVERANKVDLWKDRGSMLFMIQPIQQPKGN
jgi:hypothetical protein